MTEAALLKTYGRVDPNLFSQCPCMIVLAEEWSGTVYFENAEGGRVRESDGVRAYSRDRRVKVFVPEVWKEGRSWLADSVEAAMLGGLASDRDS
jgi:hypothetical protein